YVVSAFRRTVFVTSLASTMPASVMATAVPAATRNIDLGAFLSLLLDELTAHDTAWVRHSMNVEVIARRIVDNLTCDDCAHGDIQSRERDRAVGQHDFPWSD